MDTSYQYDGQGNYTVTLVASNAQGCVDSFQIDIVVIDAENPVQAIGDTICQGDTAAVLSVTQIDTVGEYTWQPGGNTTPSIAVDSIQATTNFIVTLVDGAGCTSRDTVTLVVVPPFTNTPFEGDSVCVTKGDDYVLPVDSTGLYIYNWNPDLSTLPIVENVDEDITFILTVNDAFNLECFQDTSFSFKLYIAPGDEDIAMPNVFTPNNDGENDFFNYVPRVGTTEGIEVVKFQVFNRWGNKVYDNETDITGWDGTSGGKEQPIETYFYIVELILKNQTESIKRSGDVTLIR